MMRTFCWAFAILSLSLMFNTKGFLFADSEDFSLSYQHNLMHKEYAPAPLMDLDQEENAFTNEETEGEEPLMAQRSEKAPLNTKEEKKSRRQTKRKPYRKETPFATVAFKPEVFEWNPKANCGRDLPRSVSIDRKHMILYFPQINLIQPRKSLFAQSNIGIGFLYFSGVKGNLFLVPRVNAKIRGTLSYNKTPLYEYCIGRRFLPWFQAAFSYQYQGGVSIQSSSINGPSITSNFLANFSFNALLGKVIFESLYPVSLGFAALTPYVAGGTGVVWQSWTAIEQHSSVLPGPSTIGTALFFRQVNPASLAVISEVGIRGQSTHPYLPLSFTAGVKFNLWGQARNLGALRKQANFKVGLHKPFEIKTVYQWAPFLGVQWNFAPCWQASVPYKIRGKNPNCWAPFVVSLNQFQDKKSIWTQLNGGAGFLYFKKIQGIVRTGNTNANFIAKGVNQNYSYNRTPVFEALVGFRPTSWLKPAISYQYQNGVSFQTAYQPNVQGADNINSFSQYISQLMFNSLMVKFYFENPMAFIWKNLATTAFVGIGGGVNWQSWTRSRMQYYFIALGGPAEGTGAIPYAARQRLIANPTFSGEAGLRMQSVFPNSPYSITLGIKYNYYGQARNLILQSQQDSFKSFNNFLSIKRIYSAVPYLGFQWSFYPNPCLKAPYEIRGRKINRWAPFWVPLRCLDSKPALWTQFNVGPGFLYFDQVSVNFMLEPSNILRNNLGFINLPFKRRLSENTTPLFDYQLGTSLLNCIKVAASYQHQSGITVRSAFINSIKQQTSTSDALGGWLSAGLTLDAAALILIFECPTSLVMKGIATTLYLGAAGGAAWQTWNQIQVTYVSQNPNDSVATLSFKFAPKVCCSGFFSGDAGLKMQSAMPSSAFSFHLGCKYNMWGQARNIGDQFQQGSGVLGFFKPLRIKTVYQFAPYAGIQWSF